MSTGAVVAGSRRRKHANSRSKTTILPVAKLKPSARNPRTHSQKQIRQIAASIIAFGWTNPILVDGEGVVIAGHGRLRAAMLLGVAQVPTICIKDMTDVQKRGTSSLTTSSRKMLAGTANCSRWNCRVSSSWTSVLM